MLLVCIEPKFSYPDTEAVGLDLKTKSRTRKVNASGG